MRDLCTILKSIEISPPSDDKGLRTTTDPSFISKMFNEFVSRYSVILGGISAVITIALIIVFIYDIWALASSATTDSPQKRENAKAGLFRVLIAIALLGSFSTIMLLAYALFK